MKLTDMENANKSKYYDKFHVLTEIKVIKPISYQENVIPKVYYEVHEIITNYDSFYSLQQSALDS